MATATYVANRDTWLSKECRMVKAGEEFQADFPEGMKLGDNLSRVEVKPEDGSGKKKAAKSDDMA